MFTILDPTLLPVPPNLSLTSRPSFSTTVLGDISGDSQTIGNRDLAIWEWTLKFKRHSDDWDAAFGYFLGRRGRQYGGLFFDPFDNNSTHMGGQGRVKTMPDGHRYLVKEYGDAVRPYYRPITCPVAESLTFSGVSGSPVLVPYNGQITGATSDGLAVFDFVCPFVFATDMMELERAPDFGDWQNVTLRELRRFTVATP